MYSMKKVICIIHDDTCSLREISSFHIETQSINYLDVISMVIASDCVLIDTNMDIKLIIKIKEVCELLEKDIYYNTNEYIQVLLKAG